VNWRVVSGLIINIKEKFRSELGDIIIIKQDIIIIKLLNIHGLFFIFIKRKPRSMKRFLNLFLPLQIKISSASNPNSIIPPPASPLPSLRHP